MKPLDLCRVLLVNTTLPISAEFQVDLKAGTLLIQVKRSGHSGLWRTYLPAINVFENFLQQLSFSALGYNFAHVFSTLQNPQFTTSIFPDFTSESSASSCLTCRVKASSLQVIKHHPQAGDSQTCFSAAFLQPPMIERNMPLI